MHEATEVVSIRALSPKEASDVTAGNRPNLGWADDFPTEGDRIGARYTRSEPTPERPWTGSWLILVDGLASGTIGFKGDPEKNRLEVGYGVVPSRQGRGVATRALTQLLALLEGRGYCVRAETAATNIASQSVLRHLGFEEVARRNDTNDEELIVWERNAHP